MSVSRIICPRCGLGLTVSEHAPRHLSCPRCLARLVNPAAPDSEDTSFPIAPVPVIPLDRQVERDTHIGRWVLLLLMGLMTIAAFMSFGARQPIGGLFVLILMAALGTFVMSTGGVRDGREDVWREEAPLRPASVDAGGTTVLEYVVPSRPARTGATVGAVAAGFFSSIGVCALGFVILAATTDYSGSVRGGPPGKVAHALVLAAVVAAVGIYITLTARYARRWRGFGPGATAGMCLGLLALGPCAACYLLTLSG
jgi:hypothetical protein